MIVDLAVVHQYAVVSKEGLVAGHQVHNGQANVTECHSTPDPSSPSVGSPVLQAREHRLEERSPCQWFAIACKDADQPAHDLLLLVGRYARNRSCQASLPSFEGGRIGHGG